LSYDDKKIINFETIGEDILSEVKVQAEKRTKEIIAFAIIILGNWVINVLGPIVFGQKPATVDALVMSFGIVALYLIFILLGKTHNWVDTRKFSSYVSLLSQVQSINLNTIKMKHDLDVSKQRGLNDLKLRQKLFEDFTTRGLNLFISPPDERQDWEIMAAGFSKTVTELDKRLSGYDRDNEIKEVLEKIPKIINGMELMASKLFDIEKEQDKLFKAVNDLTDALNNLNKEEIKIEE